MYTFIYLHVSGHFTRNASAIVIGNGWPLPFLDPYSNTEQHKNSIFFVRTITNWNHLSDDQRRPPHLRTSDDGSPPKAPSNSHACAPLPSHLYLKLGPVTYHIKIKFDKLKKLLTSVVYLYTCQGLAMCTAIYGNILVMPGVCFNRQWTVLIISLYVSVHFAGTGSAAIYGNILVMPGVCFNKQGTVLIISLCICTLCRD